LLKDRKKLASLGEMGSRMVRQELSLARMSAGLAEVYNKAML